MTGESVGNADWKRQLRRDMAARRLALGTDEHAARSARIADYLLSGFEVPEVFAFCWPIRNEPDVRAIVTAWCERGARAALPVVQAVDQPLLFREWTPAAHLEPDRYGIPTPKDGEWLSPECILIPVNGFDPAGYRLGYGGGYFDRTLAALPRRPLTIGVGFELNRLPSIHPEAHDQRVDWIVTEAGAFKSAA